MQHLVRSLSVGGAAAACLATFALPTSTPTPTELLAQAYYMRGTKIGSDADKSDAMYVDTAQGFIDNSACAGDDPCAFVLDPSTDKIDYPAEFWPLSNIDPATPTYGESVATGVVNLENEIGESEGVLVYGYSQSAVVISLYMRDHLDQPNTYVLVANPMRPNGGILERFFGLPDIPILDIPLSGATPTSGQDADGNPASTFTAYDISQQYDGWSDFPTNPLNLLATVNAIMGIALIHGNYEAVDPADLQSEDGAVDVDQYGDTTYYTLDTQLLPLLMPLKSAGVPDEVLLALDAPLRVLVEAGYDRSVNPGVPTTANIFSGPDPITLTTNFLSAIPVGIDDGVEEANGSRPLGTEEAGMYGVGSEGADDVSTLGAESLVADEPEVVSYTSDDDSEELAAQAPEQGSETPGRRLMRTLARQAFGDPSDSDRPVSRFVQRLLGDDEAEDDADDESADVEQADDDDSDHESDDDNDSSSDDS